MSDLFGNSLITRRLHEAFYVFNFVANDNKVEELDNMKRVLITLLFFVFGVLLWFNVGWAGYWCDPQQITLNVGESVPFNINSGGSAVPNHFHVASGSSPIASISPQSISSAAVGMFTITGLSRGTTTFSFTWGPVSDELDSEGCNLIVTVLEENSQSTPSPTGSQGSVSGSTQAADEGASSDSTPTEPKAPKKPKKNIIHAIPKLPGYGKPGDGSGSGEGEQPKAAPATEPMVSSGTMDHIRAYSRPKGEGDTGSTPIHVDEIPEQCCKKAEVALVQCYTIESNAVYYQCVDKLMSGVSDTEDYYVGARGASPSEISDAVCEHERLEFQVQCMRKCRENCGRRCACSSLNDRINREVINLRYGQTGGGLGEDAVPAGRLPH